MRQKSSLTRNAFRMNNDKTKDKTEGSYFVKWTSVKPQNNPTIKLYQFWYRISSHGVLSVIPSKRKARRNLDKRRKSDIYKKISKIL